jgi:Nif-specific regulatory protein
MTLEGYVDLDEVLRRALPYAIRSAQAEGSLILLHDGEARELVVAAAAGPGSEEARGRRIPDDAGLAGCALRSRLPRLATAAGDDADPALGLSARALMAAPLEIGDRVLGVMVAVNHRGGGMFDARDLERFASCTRTVAVALENASLYRLAQDTAPGATAPEASASGLVAASPALRRVLAQVDRVAAARSTVLLVGETGTGKEQLARRLHRASPWAAGPFVAINCGALPEGLLESELFGHEKGAFTGAERRRAGYFELADGGTLFLDEIGELPAAAQVKLLRVLQEQEVRRVGGTEAIPVSVRLVAATHRDLRAEVRAGRFREDLFFRVHVLPVEVPPLRERPEDVEPLALHFLEGFARRAGCAPRALTPAAADRLRAYRWPGNVRELENLVERLLVLGEDGPVEVEELAGLVPDPAAPEASLHDRSLFEQEHRLLVDALAHAAQNQSQAARHLKISREQLRTRMKRYGLLPLKA